MLQIMAFQGVTAFIIIFEKITTPKNFIFYTFSSIFVFHENFEKSFNDEEEINSCPNDDRNFQITMVRIKWDLAQRERRRDQMKDGRT